MYSSYRTAVWGGIYCIYNILVYIHNILLSSQAKYSFPLSLRENLKLYYFVVGFFTSSLVFTRIGRTKYVRLFFTIRFLSCLDPKIVQKRELGTFFHNEKFPVLEISYNWIQYKFDIELLVCNFRNKLE